MEKTVRSYGYKPIENLTGGHLIRRYELHAGVSVPPNVEVDGGGEGDGGGGDVRHRAVHHQRQGGHVVEGRAVTIYRVERLTAKKLDKELAKRSTPYTPGSTPYPSRPGGWSRTSDREPHP